MHHMDIIMIMDMQKHVKDSVLHVIIQQLIVHHVKH